MLMNVSIGPLLIKMGLKIVKGQVLKEPAVEIYSEGIFFTQLPNHYVVLVCFYGYSMTLAHTLELFFTTFLPSHVGG